MENRRRPTLPPPKRRPAGAPLALAGVRVVDFTRFVSGPMASLLLADLGAEVIKIENADTGDDSRHLLPPDLAGESATYLMANRNKRSIALDLRKSEGLAVARDLVATADVLIENFTGGVMERFGLAYADLAPKYPRLIYCAVSAIGREGEMGTRPGFDPIAQAESGFMAMNGFPDGGPIRAGPPVMDISTGMMACNAMLAALFARERLGVGQYVEVSLFDTGVVMTGPYGWGYLMTGEEPPRFGNRSATAYPVDRFETTTGPVYLACANDRGYERFVTRVLERPELASEPAFIDNAARLANWERLHAILDEEFARKPREEWVARARRDGVPMCFANTIPEAFNSEEIKARGLLSELPHPTAGRVPNVAAPFRLSGTPLADPTAAPLLGQNTREILSGLLGYDEEKIRTLGDAGAFGKQGA